MIKRNPIRRSRGRSVILLPLLGFALSTSPAAAQGVRDALVYRDGRTISVFRRHAEMTGFRFRGQTSRAPGPSFPIPSDAYVSITDDLGAEREARPGNWYAIFAVANAGDSSAKLRLMPFLRSGARQGRNLQLVDAGEGQGRTAASYSWSSAKLNGTEVLLISERGRFSGRNTSIVSASAGSVQLADPGEIGSGDFFLPAPPGFSHYSYLGSFYYEPFEIRNIFDSGTFVRAKMISMGRERLANGEVKNVELDFGGLISPLATAVMIESGGGLSTGSAGSYAEYFAGDESGHVIETRQITKVGTDTLPVLFSGIQLPFSRFQKAYFSNAGSLARTHVGGTIEIVGWIEP